jgi:hypothetical protein
MHYGGSYHMHILCVKRRGWSFDASSEKVDAVISNLSA